MVYLQLGTEYIADVERRMKKDKISQNMLAREMGKAVTQVNRWFTKNPERKVRPNMETAQEIEEALLRIKRRVR